MDLVCRHSSRDPTQDGCIKELGWCTFISFLPYVTLHLDDLQSNEFNGNGLCTACYTSLYHDRISSCIMTAPEVTEKESCHDSNDQSISEHLESNSDQTVNSFFNEEDGIVTAENFFNSAKSVLLGNLFLTDVQNSLFVSIKKTLVTRLLKVN